MSREPVPPSFSGTLWAVRRVARPVVEGCCRRQRVAAARPRRSDPIVEPGEPPRPARSKMRYSVANLADRLTLGYCKPRRSALPGRQARPLVPGRGRSSGLGLGAGRTAVDAQPTPPRHRHAVQMEHAGKVLRSAQNGLVGEQSSAAARRLRCMKAPGREVLPPPASLPSCLRTQAR
jgi:hypothetical protein